MGGNIPRGSFLGGNFLGGNFPGGNFPGGNISRTFSNEHNTNKFSLLTECAYMTLN